MLIRARIVAIVALLSLTTSPTAQTLYGVDGTATAVDQLTGPPNPAMCFYPPGPLVSSFSFVQPTPCSALGSFAPPSPTDLIGDVAIDRVNDLVFVTDGAAIGVFTPAGVELNVMPLATLGLGPLTGLGFDSSAGLLWMTDGTTIASATPSASGSCSPPTLGITFTAPRLALVTDVAWDPSWGVLYACDAAGQIAGYWPDGTLAVAAYPHTNSGCPLVGAPLTGIAIDTSTGCTGLSGGPALFVTDGMFVDYQRSGGWSTPGTFSTPGNCFPWLASPVQGLDYAARPIRYGSGTGPAIGAIGQSVLPNPSFALTLSNAPAGGQAYLVYGTGATCPPLNFLGNPWHVNPWFTPIGPLAIPASGQLTLPIPLPPPPGPVFCGISVFVQWLCRIGPGQWRTSPGLEFTTSLP